jgi:hypothetical protein
MTKPGNLSTIVKGVRISFNGMMHTPGTYSTNNAELQKAIEGSPQYGKDFVLAYSSGESAPNGERLTENVERETENGATTPVVEKPKPAGRPKKRPTENGERPTVEPEQSEGE